MSSWKRPPRSARYGGRSTLRGSGAALLVVVEILGGTPGCGSAGGTTMPSEPSPANPGSATGGNPGAPTEATKLVFVSSIRLTGNIGGLAGADAQCQSLAVAAGRSGNFRAWLSTVSTPAWMRLNHSTVPYVLRSGAVVANDWTDFTSGTLRHAISESEGDAPPPNSTSLCNPLAAWTATDERGAEIGAADCNGWTDATDAQSPVVEGVLAANSTVWSSFCRGNNCSDHSPIVCMEQ